MVATSSRRTAALSEPFEAPVGETRIAAELLRGGLRVAKPYWSDDATDLIVFVVARGLWMPIRVQIKSVQLPSGVDRRTIQGPKKKHLESDPALCLAIYRLDKDAIWFLDGAASVRRAYEAQAAWDPRLTPYAELGEDDEVPLTLQRRANAWDEWLVPRDDASWIHRRVQRVADELADEHDDATRLHHENRTKEEGSEMDQDRDRRGAASEDTHREQGDIFTWIAARLPGDRTREDIDRQIAEERASWGDG